MTNHDRPADSGDRPDDETPHNQPTKIDDPESRGTPIGVIGDLEEMAEEQGATTDPAATDAGREQLEAHGADG